MYDEAIAEYQKAQKNTNNKDEKALLITTKEMLIFKMVMAKKQSMLIRML
jgi:hypothetical protein